MQLFQNTILKLIFRQGLDSDRKKLVFSSGEPVYAADTKRLFVGDSVLSGGNVAGNIVHPTNTTIPNNFSTAVVGDLAYASDTNTLHKLKYSYAPHLSSWEIVGGVYSSGDPHIVISNTNSLELAPLSANSVSTDLIMAPIILDSGRIALSATIPIATVSTKTITISGNLKATSDGVDITNTAVNSLSSNLLITLPPLSANSASSDLLQYPLSIVGGRITLPTSSIIIGQGLSATDNGVDVTNTAVSPLTSNLVISVLPLSLSANSISSDLLQSPLSLIDGRIALPPLSMTIGGGLSAILNGNNVTNVAIDPLSGNIVIGMPQLSANSVSSNLIQYPLILNSGKIGLSSIPYYYVSTNTVTVSGGLLAHSNGVDVTGTDISLLESNLVISSNEILAMYDGSLDSLLYSRNLTLSSLSSTPVAKLSASHYRFYYDVLPTPNIYPAVNIVGVEPFGCQARVLGLTLSSCDVKVLSSNIAATPDAIVSLSLTY